MASDGIYRILIQDEQLEKMDTFPYLGSLITRDGECTKEFRRATRFRSTEDRRSGHHCTKYGKVTDFYEDTTNESAIVWP